MRFFIRHRLLTVSVAALLFIILFTSPANLNSILLTIPFILLFIVVFSLLKLLLNRYAWPRKQQLRTVIAATGASAFVVALMLQSLGQLTVRDFLLISSLAVVFIWYLAVGSK